MRLALASLIILLSAPTAWAQAQPQQTGQPQQLSGNYYVDPQQYVPQPTYPVTPQQLPQQHVAPAPRDTDAGQSVVNDIRQMNF